MTETPVLSSHYFTPGTVIGGRYVVKRLLGTGGMARVYLVVDTLENDREIALKILHQEFTEDKALVQRFIREVQLMNQVHHPHVARTYDIHTDEGLIYFSMEFVDGVSLDQFMETEMMSGRELANLIIKICDGLDAIHSSEIIHRDLKPGNILLTKDKDVKIADFGVARQKVSKLTGKNQKVGSLCYMAPEIWLGKKPTPAVDFYSLGVILYELATGDVPFEHEYPGTMMQMHLEKAVRPPVEINERCPKWLNSLVMWLLEKSAKKRPASAGDIISFVQVEALKQEPSKLLAPSSLSDNKPSVAPASSEQSGAQEDELPVSLTSRRPQGKRSKTYVLRLSATGIIDDAKIQQRPRRKATVVLPLPRRAAVILEIEAPSRDFIFFGVFFASLQVFDGFLTSEGMNRLGTKAEGNPLLRYLMEMFTPEQALVLVKVAAILMIIFATVMARRMKWIKDIIAALSCIYLFAAIIPWLYLLSNT